MFFSENLFWARFRPGEDSITNYTYTWLAYSLVAYVLLTLVRRFHVRSLPAIYLVGAACGWLTEGVIVQTAYEQFPLQLSWTGLAWHALITVVWGWYFLRQTLVKGNFRQVSLQFGLAGVFFGFWAIFWRVEEPANQASPVEFAVYAFAITALFGLCAWLFQRISYPPFQYNRIFSAIVAGVFGLMFLVAVVPVIPWAIAVLPPLLALVGWGLALNRRCETRPDILEAMTGPLPPANLLGLLALPGLAVLLYTIADILNLRPNTGWLVYLVTMPVGAFAFIASLAFIWQRSRTHPLVQAPPT
jgi:hypothetical protein